MLSGTLHKSCQSCPWGSVIGHAPGVIIMGKMMSPLFSAVLDRILFIFAANDNVHESLDEFEIRPDQTTGFHGNR